jgi:glycosyltransferase involved in cell wall biosynthesis
MVAAGAEVVIAFDAGDPSPGMNGVRWEPVEHGRRPGRPPVDLARVMAGADILVLHSAWTYHNVHAARTARRMKIPYVLEPRGAYDPWILNRKRLRKRFWWLAWEHQLVENSRAVHVFFEAEWPHLRRLGYLGPVVISGNGVAVPSDIAWDGGSGGYVLWLGRFDVQHKGVDLLIDAIGMMEEHERPHLRMHGPDSRLGGKRWTEERIRALGLARWITVGDPAYDQEKYELMKRAAGFVYPSRWEAFGNSVAEAAAIGVPTLTTPYPLGQHLAARNAGIVANPTPASLADGFQRLLGEDARAVGRRASKVVRTEFTWEGTARSWLRQVQEVL